MSLTNIQRPVSGYDSGLTDFLTWWLDHKDYVFRYWTYRKMWTPYEMEQKYIDESEYVNDGAQFGRIKEAVQLPDGDIMLGFSLVDQDEDLDFWNQCGYEYIEYRKLSEIRLEYFERDGIIANQIGGAGNSNGEEEWSNESEI